MYEMTIILLLSWYNLTMHWKGNTKNYFIHSNIHISRITALLLVFLIFSSGVVKLIIETQASSEKTESELRDVVGSGTIGTFKVTLEKFSFHPSESKFFVFWNNLKVENIQLMISLSNSSLVHTSLKI